jgi:hypothetical protein
VGVPYRTTVDAADFGRHHIGSGTLPSSAPHAGFDKCRACRWTEWRDAGCNQRRQLTNGTDNNSAPGAFVPVGSTVTFTYVVTNPGDVPLSGVTVRDNNGTPVNPTDDFNATFVGSDTNGNGFLDFPETWTFLASRIATPGQYSNIATATGTPTPGGSPVSDTEADNHFGARLVRRSMSSS